MKLRLGWVVVSVAVALCVGYLVFTATRTTAMYYRTIAEARRDINASSDVRVLGVVQNNVTHFDNGNAVRFTAGAGRDSMTVEYWGPLPDIFRPGIQVVMDGHMRGDGVFEARTVLAKCPSRFASATNPSSP
jgi:cytochrome c-type biogenesis protein CcmE